MFEYEGDLDEHSDGIARGWTQTVVPFR